MERFLTFSELNPSQVKQYYTAVENAFPAIIQSTDTGQKYWDRLESYFPDHQLYLIGPNEELIGFINTIPFQFNQELKQLPEEGWDWMLGKGIEDYENKLKHNYLGGLQVIVKQEYQGKGYSKVILNYAKSICAKFKYRNLVIPIRPTRKHEFPEITMASYMEMTKEAKIYDPWIRTHLKNGASIIKVCENSMNVKRELDFWKPLIKKEIVESGNYLAHGALSPIRIDIKNNMGEYREPNIWIYYD